MSNDGSSSKTLSDEISTLVQGAARLFNLAFPESPNYRDAVSARTPRNSDERTAPQQNALAWILSRLGHISVNPSKVENTFFLQHSYVYAADVNMAIEENRYIVNQSEREAHAFMLQLTKSARIEQVRSLDPIGAPGSLQNSNLRKWFSLTGERGAGKTFFLNHLFSKESEFLDGQNTIWVRINLVLNHGYDRDLPAWIYAQSAKIIFRYYDEESDYRTKDKPITYPFYTDLTNWIELQSFDVSYKLRLMDRLVRMRQTFIKKASDEDIAPELCDTVLCKELFRIARELGLAFIVVFDGFDRLDNDAMSRVRFRELATELEKLCVNSPAFGAAFLVVSRVPPFRTSSLNPYRLHFRDNEFRVECAKFDSIFLRRVETIIQWLSKTTPAGVRDTEVPDAIKTLLDFKSFFVLAASESSDYQEARHLDELLHSNNRAKSQILTLHFQDYCQRRSRGGYRLLELMVKAGFSYPPIAYRYVASKDDLIPTHVDSFLYDSRFIPNVFRPPVPQLNEEKLDTGRYYSPHSLLHGVRLLQCIAFFQDRTTLQGGAEALVVNEIVDFLETCFAYERAVSLCLVYEYESFELLRVTRDDTTVDRHSFDHVRILPKGRYVVEKCIHEIAYLNLCAMRILMGTRAIEECLVEAAKLGPFGSDGGTIALAEWISTKILNSVVLGALVSHLNSLQAAQMNLLEQEQLRKLGRLGTLANARNSVRFFESLRRINEQVRKEIEGVVRDAQPNITVAAIRKLRRAHGFK